MGRDRMNRSAAVPRAYRFNPRARVGRDFALIKRALADARVSIHAPAWGATGGDFHS